MEEHAWHRAETRILNVVQVVALNVVFFTGLVVTLRLEGASWAASIAIAWIGAAILTAATAAVCVLARGAGHETDLQPRHRQRAGPELVSHAVTDTLQLWEEDRRVEVAFAMDHALAINNHKKRRKGTVTMQRLSIKDSEADSVAPQPLVRLDRRQEQDPPFTEEKDRRVRRR